MTADQPHIPLPSGPVDRWLAPLARFLHIEAASGVVLLVCTAVALALANSPAAEWFTNMWKTPVLLSLGGLRLSGDVGHLIVNDGLMTIFFFVVGLEVKRELVHGELRDPAKALLAVFAAIGGVLMPAGFTGAAMGRTGAAWMGHPDGHRHRLRRGIPGIVRQARPSRPEDSAAVAGNCR
jgi:NhaA family Na+:H+ antiporter